MSEQKEAQLTAFRDELTKLSVSLKALGPVGAFAGAGMGVGAAVGGARGALRNYQDARAQGASVGQGLGSGFVGGVHGAAKGALVGGVAGGVAGAAGHHFNPVAAERMRGALSERSSFARFGQRQMHGLTGYTPEQGLASIRHGASTRLPAIEKAKVQLEAAGKGEDVRTWSDKVLRRTSQQSAERGLASAQKSHAAAQKAEDMGLTSIPGYVRSVRNNGVIKTFDAAARDQLSGSSPGMQALQVGVPALQVGAALRQDPNELNARGHTRGQALGDAAVSAATGMFMSPLPAVTQMVAGLPMGWAGGKAGRLLDRKGVQTAEQAATVSPHLAPLSGGM